MVLVHPGHRHPLRSAGHQIDGLLQQPDRVVDLVIDDHLIEVMRVGELQRLRLLLQPLERLVLMRTHTHTHTHRDRDTHTHHTHTHTDTHRDTDTNTHTHTHTHTQRHRHKHTHTHTPSASDTRLTRIHTPASTHTESFQYSSSVCVRSHSLHNNYIIIHIRNLIISAVKPLIAYEISVLCLFKY